MTKLKTVMVIDGGGRGSVLVDKYSQSKSVGKILAVPGNDLMLYPSKRKIKIYPAIKTIDLPKIIALAQKAKVDLVDVAQDDAVAAGLVNELQKAKIAVFGPTKEAGRIEWDKAWARDFMKKYKLPIPQYQICKSEKKGFSFIKKSKDCKWYIKTSGLAAGKGALFAKNNRIAIEKIKEMKNFGKSAETFLIEECLEGEEFSSFAIVSDKNFRIIGHAQDHKTVYNSSLGPNTGGMGCTSPPLAINKNIEKQITDIFRKAIIGLSNEGFPYTGIIYLGGMIGKNGKVFVIEFNARWGDPEAQVIIPSIHDDLFDITAQAIKGKINTLKIDKDYRIVVTAASRGYPQDYQDVVGKQIFGLDEIIKSTNVKIFGAGVNKKNGKYFAIGGRLFYVLASGKNIADTRKKAYSALSQIYIEGNNLHYRTDIGFRDMERFYQT